MAGFKEWWVGRKCIECQDLGVYCVLVGFLGGAPANQGEVCIYVDGRPVRTKEQIEDCAFLTGKSSQAEVVAKIKKNTEVAYRQVRIDRIGNW